VGTNPAAMRARHAECGPAAVAAGRRMITAWLAQLTT
jgi:hypothetical protein